MLSQADRVISFDFAPLSYRVPEKNRCRYLLEGFDQDWTEVDSKDCTATYTNLDPGSYTLRVQSRRTSGSWSPITASVDVVILSPWWKRTFAQVLYVVMAIGLTVLVYRQLIQRERMNLALELERAEAQCSQLKEQVAELKDRQNALMAERVGYRAIYLSGGGVAAHAPNRENAVLFLEYLASDQAQEYFSAGNDEYPAVPGVALSPSVASIGAASSTTASSGSPGIRFRASTENRSLNSI